MDRVGTARVTSRKYAGSPTYGLTTTRGTLGPTPVFSDEPLTVKSLPFASGVSLRYGRLGSTRVDSGRPDPDPSLVRTPELRVKTRENCLVRQDDSLCTRAVRIPTLLWVHGPCPHGSWVPETPDERYTDIYFSEQMLFGPRYFGGFTYNVPEGYRPLGETSNPSNCRLNPR